LQTFRFEIAIKEFHGPRFPRLAPPLKLYVGLEVRAFSC
jgi:hypothetical protein